MISEFHTTILAIDQPKYIVQTLVRECFFTSECGSHMTTITAEEIRHLA